MYKTPNKHVCLSDEGWVSENVRECSSGLRNNFGKSSEIFGKWSEIFLWQEQYLTCSLCSLVRYCSCHSNIEFISSRHRVISSFYTTQGGTCSTHDGRWDLMELHIVTYPKKYTSLKFYTHQKTPGIKISSQKNTRMFK